MKAAVFTGPNRVEIMDQPIPTIDVGEALVRVRYAGICGSDLTIFAGKNPRAKSPLIPGHEAVGRD